MATTTPTLAVQRTAGVPLGTLAALVAVSIWAGWIVATRQSVVSRLGPIDVGLLRFGVPAVILAPAWLRVGLLPRGVPLSALFMIVAGSGTVFFLVAATGMRFAPAGHIGALLPGTMPLWAALIAWFVLGERLGAYRAAGLALIAAGVLTIGGADALAAAGDAWPGHLMFLAAAALWAGYTHAFKRSGLTAVQAAGVTAAWSFLVHAALAVAFGSDLAAAPADELAIQVLAQGVLSGCVAILAYGIAVNRLGATSAASFSALVPALAALGGVLFLGEVPAAIETAGIATVAAGVALATGLTFGRLRYPGWRRSGRFPG